MLMPADGVRMFLIAGLFCVCVAIRLAARTQLWRFVRLFGSWDVRNAIDHSAKLVLR
jgi:hypothetical protein